MNATNTLETPFAIELTKNIEAKIAELKADGITAMSRANLVMVAKTPSRHLAGAPANPYGYRALFGEVIAANPKFKNFTRL